MKDSAVYEAVRERPVPQNRHIPWDEAIAFRGLKAQDNAPILCAGLRSMTQKRVKSGCL